MDLDKLPLDLRGAKEEDQLRNDEESTNQFKDTQVIPSLGVQFQISQPSKLKELKMLSLNDENRIYDSSCEYKNNDLDTQEILKDLDNQISSTHELQESINESSGETNHESKQTQSILGQLKDDVSKGLPVDSTSKRPSETPNSKLEDDTSWIKDVRDPFEDSETPWLNKIRDPFKETPASSKIQDLTNSTPLARIKTIKPSYTPAPSARKIFERLRGDQDLPELEVETQTQSAPNLMFNSLTQSPIQIKTMMSDNDMYNNSVEVRTQVDSLLIRREVPDKEASNIDQIEADNMSVPENDTMKISSTPLKSQNIERFDATQDDIQVLGTAPENHTFLETLPVEEIENAETDNHTEEVSIQYSPIAPKSNRASSSMVVSDDESNPNTESSANRKKIQGASYDLAEDSIQKYHRDFLRKADNVISDNQEKEITEESTSSSLNAESISDGHEKIGSSAEVNSGSQKMNSTVEQENNGSLDKKLSQVRQVEGTNGEQKQQQQQNGFIEFGANVTQELSDIDDDSKISNTVGEEAATKSKNKEDDDYDMPRFSKRSKRKNASIVSSPESAKRSKFIPDQSSRTTHSSSPTKILELRSDSSLSNLSSTQDRFHTDSILEHRSARALPKGILRGEVRALNEVDIIFKEFVWCQYNAQYYPGVVESADERGFTVKFIDSTDQMSFVYPLDLRIGDFFLVDRFKYIVTGLECRYSDIDMIRCMRGYDTVLAKKITKKYKTLKEGPEDKFSIGFIKMDNDEWFKRERVGADKFTKPRRNVMKDTVNHIIPTYQEELLMSTPQKIESNKKYGIFANCLFVITGDVDKDNLTDLIDSHGGCIMEDGFSSVLQLEDSISGEVLVKSKKSLRGFRFAALISNKSARSPKFLETLALGWPLLSTQFIYDSIQNSCLRTDFLTTYLLPAGESKRMKFVKSHNIFNFTTNLKFGQELSEQFKNNLLLKDRYVILTNSNPVLIRFIFNILGAKRIIVSSITNHSNFIQALSKLEPDLNCPVSSILIYHEKIKVLKTNLDGLDLSGKKTKKSVISMPFLPSNFGNLELELVDWEWVVQCLIDGCPWPSSITKKVDI